MTGEARARGRRSCRGGSPRARGHGGWRERDCSLVVMAGSLRSGSAEGAPLAPLPSHRPGCSGDGPMRGRRRRGYAGPWNGCPGADGVAAGPRPGGSWAVDGCLRALCFRDRRAVATCAGGIRLAGIRLAGAVAVTAALHARMIRRSLAVAWRLVRAGAPGWVCRRAVGVSVSSGGLRARAYSAAGARAPAWPAIRRRLGPSGVRSGVGLLDWLPGAGRARMGAVRARDLQARSSAAGGCQVVMGVSGVKRCRGPLPETTSDTPRAIRQARPRGRVAPSIPRMHHRQKAQSERLRATGPV